jgi:hypothetical protein
MASYQTFTGLCEAVSAILILFNRTRVAGLLVITSVMVNVIVLNYTFQIGVLMLSFYVLLVTLFLLAPYFRQLFRFFFAHEQASVALNAYKPMAGPKTQVPKIVAGVLIAASFIANALYIHNVYERRAAVKRSAQYYRVKTFVMNGDTLRPPENDTISWRWWNEWTAGGKRYVTITPMKLTAGKTYTVSRDTVKGMLSLQAVDNKGSARLDFRM